MATVTWETLPGAVREFVSADVGLEYLEQALRARPVEVADLIAALHTEQEVEGRYVPEDVFAALRKTVAPAPDRYEIEGYEVLERVPRAYSRQSSATLYLPLEWANKRVKVVRLDP